MWKRGILHSAVILAIILLSYANTFDVPFHFDDEDNIVLNPIIKDLAYFLEPHRAQNFQGTFQYQAFKSRFTGFFTFALNYAFHGLDVTGYHMVNIGIHIINALLVYYLVVLSFTTPLMQSRSPDEIHFTSAIALFTALLFACHPLQTQAVTYIVQRLTSLATLFYLTALVMYIRSRLASTSSAKLALYILALISAILGMKTKQIVFTLPFMIALYEFMFLEGRMRERIQYLLPLFLTLSIIPFSLIGLDRPLAELFAVADEATRIARDLSRWEYLLTEFRVIVTYIRLLFLPLNQNLDYDYPIYRSFLQWEVVASFSFLALLFSSGCYLLYLSRSVDRRLRLISFGIFWFFLALSVESSLIPLHVIYEHRTYLPSAGIFLSFTTGIFLIFRKMTGSNRIPGFSVLMVVLVLILSATTYARNAVWASGTGLWKDVVQKSPRKARAHMNLGFAFSQQGEYNAAIAEYRRALELPDSTGALRSKILRNFGVALFRLRKFSEAIQIYHEALALEPFNADILNNLAICLMETEEHEKSLYYADLAIQAEPQHEDALNTLGELNFIKNDFEKARVYFSEAIRINPDKPSRYFNSALTLEKLGRFQEACDLWKEYVERETKTSDLAEAYHHMKELGCG